MYEKLHPPAKGERLKASWGIGITNRVNELCAMAPAGMLQRDGILGIGAQPTPTNLRDTTNGIARTLPFDISAHIDLNPDKTQKRLVIYVATDGASVKWNHYEISPPEGYVTYGNRGWRVYEGEWIDALDKFQSTYFDIRLWYDITVASEDLDNGTFTVRGQWWLYVGPKANDPNEPGIAYPEGVCCQIRNYITLGHVACASSGSLKVQQFYHGNILLHDHPLPLGKIGGGGNGSGGDWINEDVVTSLNEAEGDLQLVIEHGRLEIRQNDKIVRNGFVGNVVEKLNSLSGRAAIIGGAGIVIKEEGNSIRISYNPDKKQADENPYPEEMPSGCEHPGAGGGITVDAAQDSSAGSGGGITVEQTDDQSGGSGSGCCGGGSTIASGSGVASGASGKPTTGGAAVVGKPGSSGSSGSGTSSSKPGKPSNGLFNGSTIKKKTIEDTQKSTHSQLTDTHKLKESPWAKSQKGKIQSTNPHGQLTDTKTMNESPFKNKER
jgi:hypothetical protein